MTNTHSSGAGLVWSRPIPLRDAAPHAQRIDDFSRKALVVEAQLNLPAARVIRAAELHRSMVLAIYPAKRRMDNDSEFVVLVLAE